MGGGEKRQPNRYELAYPYQQIKRTFNGTKQKIATTRSEGQDKRCTDGMKEQICKSPMGHRWRIPLYLQRPSIDDHPKGICQHSTNQIKTKIQAHNGTELTVGASAPVWYAFQGSASPGNGAMWGAGA